MENDTGSWWLFTGSIGQHGWVELSRVGNSYADYLIFIKNKLLKDLSILYNKLGTRLGEVEII